MTMPTPPSPITARVRRLQSQAHAAFLAGDILTARRHEAEAARLLRTRQA